MNEKQPTESGTQRPDAFKAEFGALAGRLARILCADGVLELFAIAAFWSLLSLGLDWSLELPRAARACFLVLLAFLALRTLFLLGRRLRQRLSLPALALAVEERHPELEGQLLNALAFQEEIREARAAGAGRLELTLLDHALRESERAARKVRFAGALDLRPFYFRAGGTAGSLGALALVCGIFPSTTGLWAERNLFLSNAEWPRETRLELDRQE